MEYYVYMNMLRLGNKVKFLGYKHRLDGFANLFRIAITRFKLIRDLSSLFWLNKINEEIKQVAVSFCPDMILSIKGEVVDPKTIEWASEQLGAVTALWYPDDPRYFNGLVKHIAPSYDHVFTASERILAKYKQIGVRNVHYLPFACEPTVHTKVELNQEDKDRYAADLVFVGIYSYKRARIIRGLEKAGIDVRVYGPWWTLFSRHSNYSNGIYGLEMVKALNSAKIVLNIHVDNDLPYKVNMRTFEVTGSRGFLLTDKPYDLDKYFDIGKELVCYRDEKELVDLVKNYLDEREEREMIALAGQNRTYREHTYEQRSQKLINTVF